MNEMPTSSEHTEFCERIKARRLELGLTQAQCAERLGVSPAAFAEIERGRNEPSFYTIYRVAAALKTTVHDLLPVSTLAQ
jgi:transcriptional regulator with XRE-family HTH domain